MTSICHGHGEALLVARFDYSFTFAVLVYSNAFLYSSDPPFSTFFQGPCAEEVSQSLFDWLDERILMNFQSEVVVGWASHQNFCLTKEKSGRTSLDKVRHPVLPFRECEDWTVAVVWVWTVLPFEPSQKCLKWSTLISCKKSESQWQWSFAENQQKESKKKNFRGCGLSVSPLLSTATVQVRMPLMPFVLDQMKLRLEVTL